MTDALQRAFGVAQQSARSVASVTRVALRSRQVDFDRTLENAKHLSQLILMRARSACDRLQVAIEFNDFHGPLARGFVMVTDQAGRWLRIAAETVPLMRLNYRDGVVQVRKDET